MKRVVLLHDGERHELALWDSLLCVDCRYLAFGRCKLFDVLAGLRPAACISAEAAAKKESSE
jgi:hypothetical protein